MRDYGPTNVAPYAVAPAIVAAGGLYWNTAESALYGSDGVVWQKVGPGAGGAASGPAGGDLSGTYPNPTVVKASTSAGFTVPISNAIKWGSGSVLGRLIQGNSTKRAEFTFNMDDLGVQDDVALPSWRIRLGSTTDDIQFNRHPPGGAVATLASLSNVGGITLKGPSSIVPGAAGTTPILALGTGSSPVRFRIGSITAGNFQFYSNASLDNLKDDTSLPSLAWVYDAPAREFGLYGAPAGTNIAWSQMLAVNAAGLWLPTAGTALAVGSLAAKGRVVAHPTVNGVLEFDANMAIDAAGVRTQDSASLPSWMARLNTTTDAFEVWRSPAGSVALASLFSISAAGVVNIGTPGVAIRSWWEPGATTNWSCNHPWAPQDATKASWLLQLSADSDVLNIWRRAPNAGTGVATAVLVINNTNKVSCTLADRIVNRAMIGFTGTLQSSGMSIVAGAVNITPVNTWIFVVAAPTQSFAGTQYCTVLVTFDLIHFISGSSAISYYAIFIDGGEACRQQINSGSGMVSIGCLQWVGALAAGNHSFDFRVYNGNVPAVNVTNSRISVLVY